MSPGRQKPNPTGNTMSATPQKNKEHIIKNQTSITYIERELQQIKNQLHEVQSTHYKFELNHIPSILNTLTNIDSRLEHIEEKDRSTRLSFRDKLALYTTITAAIGLIIVEVIKIIL
ncbi:hypothetical protein [Candidatus Bathycorpusculum sp.]|uniref:hypothetical protein n=1 Tax=Candidatus Bathycorpusculum sp. TaxID=2994959 RepID=UPI00282B052B|nr:hypothetical protein [Candidatus Termitimicrobium sp.]